MDKNLEFFHDVVQGTPEWFELRRGLCTASEATTGLLAAAKGFETYLIQKEAELHLAVIEEDFSSYDMRRGSELEPLARQELAEELLVEIEQIGFIRNLELGAGCSPDGLINREIGVEIKCLNSTNHYRAIKHGMRSADYNQMMFSMTVTGIEKWIICYYNPDFKEGYRLKYYALERNDAVCFGIKQLLMKVKKTINE